jgi:putative bacteriocin precursor
MAYITGPKKSVKRLNSIETFSSCNCKSDCNCHERGYMRYSIKKLLLFILLLLAFAALIYCLCKNSKQF